MTPLHTDDERDYGSKVLPLNIPKRNQNFRAYDTDKDTKATEYQLYPLLRNTNALNNSNSNFGSECSKTQTTIDYQRNSHNDSFKVASQSTESIKGATGGPGFSNYRKGDKVSDRSHIGEIDIISVHKNNNILPYHETTQETATLGR